MASPKEPIFIGVNHLHFNIATMCKAIEVYLGRSITYDSQVPKVTNVKLKDDGSFDITLDSRPEYPPAAEAKTA